MEDMQVWIDGYAKKLYGSPADAFFWSSAKLREQIDEIIEKEGETPNLLWFRMMLANVRLLARDHVARHGIRDNHPIEKN